MAFGQLTPAVVTAQVASSFVSQGPSPAQSGPPAQAASPTITLDELDQRLARIERLLTATTPPRTSEAPDREPGGD
jgi:hypothetical protein